MTKMFLYHNFVNCILGRDPSILDDLDLTEEERAVLIDNINRRLTPQAVKIRADIEVACYGYEGIDAVKEALKAGLKCSTECMPIKVRTQFLLFWLYKFTQKCIKNAIHTNSNLNTPCLMNVFFFIKKLQ